MKPSIFAGWKKVRMHFQIRLYFQAFDGIRTSYTRIICFINVARNVCFRSEVNDAGCADVWVCTTDMCVKFDIRLQLSSILRLIYVTKILIYWLIWISKSRSQWQRGLRRGSAAARLLWLRVRIPPGAWMCVCCECCVFVR
jgi:hypothetical protein